MPANHSIAEKLCLTCGLCCNGVIFADVQLQSAEELNRLKMLGFPLRKLPKSRCAENLADPSADPSPGAKFSQPCTAFDGCSCRIYKERPIYCRTFECALLKSVNEGRVKTTDALNVIEKARRRAARVQQLLRQLGDKDEKIALSLRFRRTMKRIQNSALDPETGVMVSQLTLAVQDLNVLLSKKFYPNGS